MNAIYPKAIMRRTLGRQRYQLSQKYSRTFSEDTNPEKIEEKQIELFNKTWQKAQELPFYSFWKLTHNLPDQIESIADLGEWPVLTKDDLRANRALMEDTPSITGYYRTSGSTSEPFGFPSGKGEIDDRYATMWSYRIGHGLYPFDPFLSVANTLSGAAQSRFVQLKNRLVRGLKDLAGNSWKSKGFIASKEDADRAILSIKVSRPRYLIGFTSGITAIARRIEERKLNFPFLTHVILTSETIDDADIRLIQRALNVEVLIEYGAVELGVVAGTVSGAEGWPIKVTWWNYIVRMSSDDSAVITALSPQVFPLINYAIGDIIRVSQISPQGSVLEIEEIQGRSRDFVNIAVGGGGLKNVSAREIAYLVRDLDGVDSVQVMQLNEGAIRLYVVSPNMDRDILVERMAASVKRNQKDLSPGSIEVAFVDHHIASARGKRGVVIDLENAPPVTQVYSLDD